MTQPPRIDAGTTRLFTVQYSGNPMAAPRFNAVIGSAEAVVFSAQATSAATAYQFQQTLTMPGTPGVYAYEWSATFSGNPTTSLADITRGLFQVIVRNPWS
jgi:hypothetical protein